MKEKNNLYTGYYSDRQLFRVFSVQEAWDDFTSKINKTKKYSLNGINYDGYKKVMAEDYKCFITDEEKGGPDERFKKLKPGIIKTEMKSAGRRQEN